MTFPFLARLIGDNLWLEERAAAGEIPLSVTHPLEAAREMMREASRWHDDESMGFPGLGNELPVCPD